MIIEPWYWLILGLILIIIDLFLLSYVSLSVGIAAVIIGLLALILPMNWFLQVVIWLIVSIITTIFGFKYIKPRMATCTTAGLGSGIIIGETGMIIQSPQNEKLGKIRFSVPIFGADEWMCRSEDNQFLQVGERAIVVDVVGNELLVKSMTHNN